MLRGSIDSRMTYANAIRSRLALLVLWGVGCSTVVPGHSSAPPPKPKHVASGAPVTPTTEANITRLTSSILERSQFAHHPLDAEFAGKFLDSFLDELDGTRSLFLAADLREFSAYRATLAEATRETGDTSAARAIMARYLERLAQQTTYAEQLLQTEKFDFSGQDSFAVDREHAERPADLPAAQALWKQQLRAQYLQEKLSDTAPDKIAETLTRRYSQQLATMRGLSKEEVLDIYLNSLAHVYDPHSDYLGHEQMESLSIAMNLALFGIGATLETSDGYCQIRALVAGGPAAQSGALKPGDRIVGVAQAGKPMVEIKNMPLSRTVELIRGPKGTALTLSILPEGAKEGSVPQIVPLVRDEIKLEDEQASARIVDLPRGKNPKLRLGVLDLPSFYANMSETPGSEPRSVTADVARLLTKLKAEKIEGLIIDLRHNGGGSLNEAISLTGLFIPEGPVVQTRGPSGAVKVDSDSDPRELYQGPLVLLTSRFSASASEILTGALQDYERAVVVGDSSTFGKGTVQSVLPLARVMDEAGLSHNYDPGALKVTIQKFYRPSGASTQLRGVVSDLVLPSTSDFSEVSEAALKNPLPWDTVPAAAHDHFNRVAPYVERLREASKARITVDPAFAYLAKDIAALRKNIASKTISLNEVERRAELAETKAREDEREQQSKALRESAATSYDVTLANASNPGLTPSAAREPAKSSPGKRGLRARKSDLASTDDIRLLETERILADYVGLIGKGVTAGN